MFTKYLTAAVLSLAASAAFAMAPGPYVGVNVASTRIDDLDDSKTGYGAFVGYGINSTFAFEIGYRQHGDWDFNGTEVKMRQTEFTVLGALPLSKRLDLYARVGYGYARIEADRGGYRGEGSLDSAIYGVGLGYAITPHLSGRVELQKPASDITSTIASLVWKF